MDRNNDTSHAKKINLASLSARRAWIEMLSHRLADMSAASLSARRAWIEIAILGTGFLQALVALRKESVDRNFLCLKNKKPLTVALRKESVDRNTF